MWTLQTAGAALSTRHALERGDSFQMLTEFCRPARCAVDVVSRGGGDGGSSAGATTSFCQPNLLPENDSRESAVTGRTTALFMHRDIVERSIWATGDASAHHFVSGRRRLPCRTDQEHMPQPRFVPVSSITTSVGHAPSGLTRAWHDDSAAGVKYFYNFRTWFHADRREDA